MRGWSHEQKQTLSPGSPGTGRAVGAGAPVSHIKHVRAECVATLLLSRTISTFFNRYTLKKYGIQPEELDIPERDSFAKVPECGRCENRQFRVPYNGEVL